MTDGAPVTLHATAVGLALDRDGPLVGVLITGASGLGKSVLTLNLIEQCPWRRTSLVGDDVVEIFAQSQAPWARGFGPMAGQIEVRGFGPVPVRTKPAIALGFVLALQIERPPRLYTPQMKGLAPTPWSLPQVPFWCEDAASHPARVRVIARTILAGQIPL